MNLLIRLFWLLTTARFRKRVDLLDECVLNLRVWPTDLDINMHMTNARYLSIMDLGRTELILQTSLFKKIIKRGWLPVVAHTNLQFRFQLNPFQRYQLKTRLIGWDEKWVYLEQRFETDRGLAAVGLVKGLFRSKNGNIPSTQILQLAGFEGASPELPAELEFMTRNNSLSKKSEEDQVQPA